jgi:phosphoribosyl 1,2-cyclic phosphate phosphodiesterase
MKFKYLGTAAAEGFPAMFCDCEYCMEARKRKGKNIRTRSQSIINEDLLIDLPADTYIHAINNDLEMFKVGGHNIAINHSPDELKSLAEYVTTEEENGVYEALVHLGLIDEKK